MVGKRKLNWITGRKKTEPEVPYTPPVWLGNLSNGEFFLPAGDRERKVQELILNRCDEFGRCDSDLFVNTPPGSSILEQIL